MSAKPPKKRLEKPPEKPPETPLRILYHHRVAAADGMRVHIDAVVQALRADGHLVEVVGPPSGTHSGGAGPASRLERLAEAARAALPGPLYEILELAYNLPAGLRLRRAARRFRPDVIYERYNLFLLAGLVTARSLGLPLVLEVNAPLARERAADGALALKRLGRLCEAAVWRGADLVLPVTGVLAEEVRRVRGPRPIEVAPNGADPYAPRPDRAAARRRLGAGADDVVLGFTGFVRPWHGLAAAVQALAGLPPNVRLAVVGDGPARAGLAAQAAAVGVAERVTFLGRLPHAEVRAVMAGFDVGLQPAATPYASPLKLFEYMALGLPVVAPDQPNIREVLTDGVDALLAAPGDEAALAAALARAAREPALRRRLGAAARRRLETAPFTWRAAARRIARDARRLAAPTGSAASPAAALVPERR